MTINEELADELLRMRENDQRIRQPPAEPSKSPRFLSHNVAMEHTRVDVQNTDRLREIVRERGWPGRSLVGTEGAAAAWLLAQHADRQLDFQRAALELLHEAVKTGEAETKHLAYLTDRVRMNEGRQQVYGTQIYGGNHPWPIEDADDVDVRRAAMGLEPLADYLRGFTARH